jgi:hypothetical protein
VLFGGSWYRASSRLCNLNEIGATCGSEEDFVAATTGELFLSVVEVGQQGPEFTSHLFFFIIMILPHLSQEFPYTSLFATDGF